MVLGQTYAEARATFGEPGTGWTSNRWWEALARSGWAHQFFWRTDQATGQRRDAWPLAPWAPLHLVAVDDGRHVVIVEADGTVLDPAREGPRALSDYVGIAYMAGLYQVGASPALGARP